MEDDSESDTEMADYGTDFSDDVDRNFDAKARPQQGSTVEIRCSDFLCASRGPKGTNEKINSILTPAKAVPTRGTERQASPF